ncbi:hypothetical protein E0494_00470 [Marinilabiliaceae bacterium JC040]|nr:hypothetical protein [Marinilabiliaceae bacterium JC040]
MEEELEKNKPSYRIDHRIISAKRHVYDWLSDITKETEISEMVEVRFKNTRVDFFLNDARIPLKVGDVVAVEASPGHDIGVVILTGPLVREQMNKHHFREDIEFKKVYRLAKQYDIEKWEEAISLEHETMIRSRQITKDLGLEMKIGDVEYQGDKTKAIFYYIADGRVDFRQLIRVLAETFRIRIEMKQIGARQEAGRIGGIGPCGRELCCASFMTNFVSVTTAAARYQEISLNPQKLAGQCGKLKCCLNYEVDAYLDEQRDFPSTQDILKTEEGNYHHVKTDVFSRKMTYATYKDGMDKFETISVDRAKEILSLNRKNKTVEKIQSDFGDAEKKIDYENVVGQDSLNRFDNKIRNSKRRNNKRNVRTNKKKKVVSLDKKVDLLKNKDESSNKKDSLNKKAIVNKKEIQPKKDTISKKNVPTKNKSKSKGNRNFQKNNKPKTNNKTTEIKPEK